MPDEDFYKFLFAAFVNMEQNMENNASIYVFHADSKGLIFRQAFHLGIFAVPAVKIADDLNAARMRRIDRKTHTVDALIGEMSAEKLVSINAVPLVKTFNECCLIHGFPPVSLSFFYAENR